MTAAVAKAARWILAAGFLLTAAAGARTGGFRAEDYDRVIARVGGEPVTVSDLMAHARRNPLVANLSAPDGLRRLLDDLVATRLLTLEGKRRGMPVPPPGEGGEVAYVLKVRRALVKPCPPADEKTLRAYFQAHPYAFGVPPMVRLKRIALRRGTPAAMDRLRGVRRAIEEGRHGFDDYLSWNQEPISRARQGDLGFIPLLDPKDPLQAQLAEAKTGDLVGPVEQDDYVSLYRVTDRRAAVVPAFDQVRAEVRRQWSADCWKRHFEAAMEPLRRRWPVEIYLDAQGNVRGD